jgi:hypothetical protein
MRCREPALSTKAYCQVELRGREGFEDTDVAMSDLSDSRQDDYASVSVVQKELGPARALTFPLGLQDRDHGGRWADGRVTMLAER